MQEYNIPNILSGDTYDGVQFEVIVNSAPKDLTNTGIKVYFRRQSKTGAIQKSISNGSGITKTDAVNGVFQIDAFTVDFPAGTYYYDIQFNDSGVINTYVGGYWNILQDVTV
jgi:hypothetical protein